MGVRAFVARKGWQLTPISAEEWLEAASTLPDLDLHRGAGPASARALLRGSRRRGVVWHNGYLSAEHVNERLAGVLFVLADRLNARVYSERRRAYADVADWVERVHGRRRPGRRASAPAVVLPGAAGSGGGGAWVTLGAAVVLFGLLVTWALQ